MKLNRRHALTVIAGSAGVLTAGCTLSADFDHTNNQAPRFEGVARLNQN